MALGLCSGVFVALLVVGCGQDDSSDVDAGQAPADQQLITDRRDPVVVSASDQLFVYGGLPPIPEGESPRTQMQPLGDAFLLDVGSGEVVALPDPPFEAPLSAGAVALAVGNEVVLLGPLCERPIQDTDGRCEPGTYRAAVLSVPERRWRDIEVPAELEVFENALRMGVGVSTGGQAIFLLGSRFNFEAPPDLQLWAYSAAGGDVLERLPDPGVRIEDACVAGDTLVVVTDQAEGHDGELIDEDQPQPPGGALRFFDPSLRLLSLAEADRQWVATDPADVPSYAAESQVTCSDSLALIDDGGGSGLALRNVTATGEGEWQRPPPNPSGGVFTDILSAGETFVFVEYNGTGVVSYDAAAGRWEEQPALSTALEEPVLVGDRLVGWPIEGEADEPAIAATIETN
jgi:hypothetical protein